MKFMPGPTEKVNRRFAKVQWVMPNRLHTIRMKNGIVFFADGAHRINIQDIAYLIIGMH